MVAISAAPASDASSAGEAALSTRRRVGGLATLAAGHAVNDSYSYVLQALLPAIIPSLGLTLGMAGGLVSLYQLTSSVLQPVMGHLADRSNLRWPAFVGIALSGVAAGSLGLAPSYAVLMGLLLMGGVGTAIFHPVSAAIAGSLAPAHSRGRWLGLYVTAGNYGLALGPLMLAPLLAGGGPSNTWPIMLPSLAIALFVALVAPRPNRKVQAAPDLRETVRKHGRMLWSLLLVVGLRAWSSTAVGTFIPLLGQSRGLSVSQAAQILTVYLVAGATGGLAAGFAADRWGRDRVLVGTMLLAVPFGVYLAVGGDVGPTFVAAAAATGFFLNGSLVVLVIRGQESIPGSVGMVTGLLLGTSTGLGGLAVTPLALFSEWWGLPAAAAIASLVGGFGAVAMRFVPPAPPRSGTSG